MEIQYEKCKYNTVCKSENWIHERFVRVKKVTFSLESCIKKKFENLQFKKSYEHWNMCKKNKLVISFAIRNICDGSEAVATNNS